MLVRCLWLYAQKPILTTLSKRHDIEKTGEFLELNRRAVNSSSARAESWEDLDCQQWESVEFLPGSYHRVTWHQLIFCPSESLF